MGNIFSSVISCGCNKVPSKNNDKDKFFKPDIVDLSRNDESVLIIEKVDFCNERNSTNHRTKRFSETTPNLVVRRGQEFKLLLELNRAFDKNSDAFCFIFSIVGEDRPSLSNGTLQALVPSDGNNDNPSNWTIKTGASVDKTLEIIVKPAANAPVMVWKLAIDIKNIRNSSSNSFIDQNLIYILFNPWCEQDLVYLPDEDKRQEYVLQDTTLIYRGSHNSISPTVWKVGQFDKDVLQCSMDLISRIGKISSSNRGDPVKIARVLSAVVNSPDDNCVLEGNWGKDFSKGKAPFYWLGSSQIIQDFYRTWSPVKYGQCWVFAGVVTTIARVLGIPSRVITNFSSAHDTDCSMTIDYFVNRDDDNMDSIWNFHVWNEVWMRRPDLGDNEDYSGWQAVDSTPQEVSNGMYQCGPASVKAVKRGDVLRPYDCQFLFSEVNADRLFWPHNGPDKPMKLISKDTTGIGQFLSTKAVGKWEREDVTHEYKFEEKSEEERNIMLKVLKQSQHVFSKYYLNEEFKEVHFEMDIKDDIKIGEKFMVHLKVTNKSGLKVHRASGNICADTVLYNRNRRVQVKAIPFEVAVRPGSTEYVSMEVDFQDYYKKLLPQAAFKISCSAQVQNTDYDYYAQNDFRVRKPDIKFEISDTVSVEKSVDVVVILENPLPIPIKKGTFIVSGTSLKEDIQLKVTDIPAGGFASTQFQYSPSLSGPATIVAKFHSKELDDVDGFTSLKFRDRISYINQETI
ncbi:F13A1 family protein [Megaselia abdita]